MTFRYPPESKPLDGYTIKRAIQRGGFGEVYFALSDAGKEVALKLLQTNLDIELRGVSQCLNLKHPNLLTLFDVKQNSSGEHWVVMEYMAGQTLDAVLAAQPAGLPIAQVEQLLQGIADGVSYLHGQGLVHRDLNPANIYVENGLVKIGDVGLSKFISVSHRSGHTESVGTVYYMAPEIAHGRYGHEIDVYALGVILFEMLTGKVPFEGETTGEILMKQLTQPPDLSSLQPKLRPVLQRALAKDPAHRTPSAQALVAEFRAASKPVVPIPVTLVASVPSDSKPEPVPVFVQPSDCFLPDTVTGTSSNGNSFLQWIVDRPVLAVLGLAVPWFYLIAFTTRFAGMPRALVPTIAGACLLLSFIIVRIITAIVRGTFLSPPREAMQSVRQRSKTDDRVHRLNEEYHRYRGPETRELDLLDRLAEMTGSMAVAALCSALIALALWWLNAFVKSPSQATFFAIGTTLGSWAAIMPAKLWEGRGRDGVARRIATMTLGAIAGATLFAMSNVLKIDMHIECAEHVAASWAPTFQMSRVSAMALQGYSIFFAALLLARRWWYRVDAYRDKRLSFVSIIITTGAAFVLSLVTRFPTDWAVMWGLTMSAVSQLAAVWIPTPERQRS